MREDSAGDGMAEEGGVDETDEDSEDSLMLTISGLITLTGTSSGARLTQSDHTPTSGPVNAHWQFQRLYLFESDIPSIEL